MQQPTGTGKLLGFSGVGCMRIRKGAQQRERQNTREITEDPRGDQLGVFRV